MKKNMIILAIVQIVLGVALVMIGTINICIRESEKEMKFLESNHRIELDSVVNLTDYRTGETKRMSGVEYWDRLMK